MPNGNSAQNYINHVALVIDASGSMAHLKAKVVQVADDLIGYLAKKSTEMDQETRVTVYVFDDRVNCVIFDKDVLRLPSLAKLYHIGGMTALIDATLLSIDDLRQTMTKYGDHAFLTYVLTDGAENRSHRSRQELRNYMEQLRDNETVAVQVPNEGGRQYALGCGFAEGNVAIWETTEKGLTEAATQITRSVDTYMTNRTLGVRATKGLFTTDTSAVNKATVNSKKLKALPRTEYTLLNVKNNAPDYTIREWVESQFDVDGNPMKYEIGKAYYQLMKTETIQASKGVALQNIRSGRIYTGQEARNVLNLPDVDARVKPDQNDEYRIFVQSTSVNRKLIPGTKLLVLK